jgi:phytoene desaturase
MAEVVVIGGGVGGLAAAVRLQAAGHHVRVLERNPTLGGKLDVYSEGGYTFETGPSLLTLPHVFDDLFRLAGTTLADEVDLVRLDPQMRYHWSDGATLDVHDDPADTEAAMEEFRAGAGAAWRRFDAHGRRIWDVSERTFFAGPMSSPLSLARRLRSPRDLVDIDPMRTLAGRAGRFFDDPRLVQWAGRYATYSGSSPFRAPATLACIPHIESRYGAWTTRGGLGALRDALVRVVRRLGVTIETSTEVRRVLLDGAGSVAGVEVVDVRGDGGVVHRCDVVVANADARHLYADLLPDRSALRRVGRADLSTSGFVVLVGARGTTPGIAHHNVWFSDDSRAEFAELEAGRVAPHPTVYACVSSVTDPSQAPPGCENWFLLVNVPAAIELDVGRETDRVLGRLADFGIDLAGRAEVVATRTPADIAERYRTDGGAIYGTSSNGRRAAFVRPRNRGARRGLYLVGGSSHPGGGLPLVTMSGRIVADMIAADGWS